MGDGFWIIIKNYLLLPLRIFARYYDEIGRVVSDPMEEKGTTTPVLRWWIATARGIIVLVGSVVAILFAFMAVVLLFQKGFGYTLIAALWFMLVYPLLIIVAALSVELLALLMNLAADVHAIAEASRRESGDAARAANAKAVRNRETDES
jgi:hypothetical protein